MIVSVTNYSFCYHSKPGVRTGSGMNYSYCYRSKPDVKAVLV